MRKKHTSNEDNKSNAAANVVNENNSNSNSNSSPFADNRPEAIAQRKLKNTIFYSPMSSAEVLPVQRVVSEDKMMANASKYNKEIRQTETEAEIYELIDYKYDATHGLYKTDAPESECTATWSSEENKVTKLVLPELLDKGSKDILSTGITREQQYHALALHELMHVRQGLHNNKNSPQSRLGTNAESFGPEKIVDSLRMILGFIPKVLEVPKVTYFTGEEKGNALRTYVIDRLIYLTKECIKSIDAGNTNRVEARLILMRFNLEAPTVIAELEKIIKDAIGSKPIIADEWQSLAKLLSAFSEELFIAGKL